METTREKIEVMQAHEKGEQIQIYCSDIDEWEDVETTPLWDWVTFNYRVKSKKIELEKFKDGDILFATSLNSWIFIFKENENKKSIYKYVAVPICTFDTPIYINDAKLFDKEYISEIRFATEEEKQKLFDILKENNYHWNAETKTLEKTKFDITTLKPFDKVLVRDEDGQKWMCDIFSYYDDKNPRYPFWGAGRSNSKQCIPYKGNEHLLGTTNDCDDFYKTW